MSDTNFPTTISHSDARDEAERLVFAAVADDDTGASDLAGMLAGQGLRTLLVIDLPTHAQFAAWTRGYEAVVMAEGTRNCAPAVAAERTRAAIRLLQTRQPRTFQVKYCSTFDSTDEGNIGPTIDAALDELGEDFTVALPALPVNGRTTYQGHHFVHEQLLSDSPMRLHPLTPMTNSNLVAFLSRQTGRKVGLAPFQIVESGAEALQHHFQTLRAEGVQIALVDCLNDAHLESICRAVADMRLLTGSSAFGIHLPAVWRERGWLASERDTEAGAARGHEVEHESGGTGGEGGADGEEDERGGKHDAGCLLVAGSCSAATQRQNEWFANQGHALRRIHPPDLLDGKLERAGVIEAARLELAAGRHYLLTTTGASEDVRAVQEWATSKGLTVPALGDALADALAALALEVLENQIVGGLIAAGGETSGAICRRLELGALAVGRNIEPGVPLCRSLGRFRFPVVLKSGNFGGDDFYGKALAAVAESGEYLTF